MLGVALVLGAWGIWSWYLKRNAAAAEVQVQLVKEEPLMLYYRVPKLLTKQVKSGELGEVTGLLREFLIPYLCGQTYQGSWQGDRWVPIAIQKCGWQSRIMKDKFYRRMVRDEMLELGIEAVEKGWGESD
jgi:hypothetical protein